MIFNEYKQVLLELENGELVLRDAYTSQSGLIAKYDAWWHILKPGGEVVGTNEVKRWYPHKGIKEC